MLAIVIMLLSVLACAPSAGTASTTSPPPDPALPTGAVAGACPLIAPDHVASAVGEPARLDESMPNSSTSCTFSIGASATQTYHVNLRLEGDFADIASVSRAFPQGRSIERLGDGAWWAPELTTLWVERQQQLVAVQLFGFPGGDDAALHFAETLAGLWAG